MSKKSEVIQPQYLEIYRYSYKQTYCPDRSECNDFLLFEQF